MAQIAPRRVLAPPQGILSAASAGTNPCRRLSQDAEVANRLIQQALYFLGVGHRKHDFDKKLVDGRN